MYLLTRSTRIRFQQTTPLFTLRPTFLASLVLTGFLLGSCTGFSYKQGNAAEPAPSVAAGLPPDVNSVVVINASEIYSSALSIREKWFAKSAEAFVQADALIPPGTERVIIGGECLFERDLRPQREYSLIELASPTPLSKLEQLGFGQLTTVAGQPAIQLPDGGMMLEAGEKRLAFHSAAPKAATQRWLKQLSAKEQPALSTYLTQQMPLANEASILVLFDTDGILNEATCRAFLQSLSEGAKIDPKAALVLASLRGVSLQIKITDTIEAQLTFTFGQPSGPLMSIAKPALGAFLQQLGASNPALDDWTLSGSSTDISFAGPITKAAVRRILGLYQTTDYSAATSPAEVAESSTAATIAASQKYVKSIETILEDVREALSKQRDNHATWVENAARKIDRLPVLNVDERLISFSQKVSNSLRYQGQTFRMANIRAGARAQAAGANRYYGSYNWAQVAPYGNTVYSVTMANQAGADGVAIKKEENLSARDVQFSEWRQIEDGFVQVRRELSADYKAEF